MVDLLNIAIMIRDNNSEIIQGYLPVEETKEGVFVPDTTQNVLRSNITTVFFPIFYIFIFIVGLPTNAMAIWVFLFRTKKKHPASILMANLALADLLFIVWLPLKISYHLRGNDWIFGEALCKVLVGFFYGNMYCSTIFIACISVQRYCAVVHPLSRKLNNRAAVCVCVSVWLVVFLVTVPLYLYDQTVTITDPNITTCQDVTRRNQTLIPVVSFLTMGIVGYVVPCVVCIVAYTLTFCSLRRSITEVSSHEKRKKALILMVTVLVMFLVCFTPSNIMLVVHYSLLNRKMQDEAKFLEDTEGPNDFYTLYIVTLCLSSLNSCLDPFVYYLISEEFREQVRNTLMCQSERSAKRQKVSFTPVKFFSEDPALISSTRVSTV